jgi:pimeloyl-ACP methyl ester carboxylesterase
MPVIKAGSFDLDVLDVGTGPAVVLLHSSASGHRQWRRLVDELKDRYRLIAVNLFGYGATSPWPAARAMTLGDQAELAAAAAGLADGPVTLVGHSLGAAVALETALRLGPRAAALIVFEPIPFYLLKTHGPPAAADEIVGIADGFCAHAAKTEWAAGAELFIDYWSGAGTWATLSDERRDGILTMVRNVVHEFDAVIEPWRALAEWGAIAVPTHIIRAADTRAPTHALATLLSATYPHWGLHEVATGGHMAPVARPDLVNPLIGKILGQTMP